MSENSLLYSFKESIICIISCQIIQRNVFMGDINNQTLLLYPQVDLYKCKKVRGKESLNKIKGSPKCFC